MTSPVIIDTIPVTNPFRIVPLLLVHWPMVLLLMVFYVQMTA